MWTNSILHGFKVIKSYLKNNLNHTFKLQLEFGPLLGFSRRGKASKDIFCPAYMENICGHPIWEALLGLVRFIDRQFIDTQFIDSQFIDTTVLWTPSLSTDRFIDSQFIDTTFDRQVHFIDMTVLSKLLFLSLFTYRNNTQ